MVYIVSRELWQLLNSARNAKNQPATLAAGRAVTAASKGLTGSACAWQALAEYEMANPSETPSVTVQFEQLGDDAAQPA